MKERSRARCRLRDRLFVGGAGRLARSVVALEQDPALARLARRTLRPWAPPTPGGYRSTDARLAPERPTTSSSSMGRPRPCRDAVSPAQGRRTPGRRDRPAPVAGRCSTARSRAMSAGGRSSMPARRCCRVLLRLPPSSSKLGRSASLFTALVWRESTKGRFFAKVSFSSRFRGTGSPILVNIGR